MIKPNFAPTASDTRPSISFEPLIRGARPLLSGVKFLGRVVHALLPGPFLIFLGFEALVQASLGTRLYYAFDGSQPSGPILERLYDLSGTLVAPFSSWDGEIPVDSSRIFHLSTIVAMDAYLFAGIAVIVTYTILRSGFGIARWSIRLQARRTRRRRAQPVEPEMAQPTAMPEAAFSDQVA